MNHEELCSQGLIPKKSYKPGPSSANPYIKTRNKQVCPSCRKVFVNTKTYNKHVLKCTARPKHIKSENIKTEPVDTDSETTTDTDSYTDSD